MPRVLFVDAIVAHIVRVIGLIGNCIIAHCWEHATFWPRWQSALWCLAVPLACCRMVSFCYLRCLYWQQLCRRFSMPILSILQTVGQRVPLRISMHLLGEHCSLRILQDFGAMRGFGSLSGILLDVIVACPVGCMICARCCYSFLR